MDTEMDRRGMEQSVGATSWYHHPILGVVRLDLLSAYLGRLGVDKIFAYRNDPSVVEVMVSAV